MKLEWCNHTVPVIKAAFYEPSYQESLLMFCVHLLLLVEMKWFINVLVRPLKQSGIRAGEWQCVMVFYHLLFCYYFVNPVIFAF